QVDALAKLQKHWRSLPRGLVAMREQAPFDWEPTAPAVAFSPLAKGTRLTIEAKREDDGDVLVVVADAQRLRVSLGKDALAMGPVGIEAFGRAVLLESVTVEGTLD